MIKQIGNPSHWFGDYYLGGGIKINKGQMSSIFILYNPNKPLSRAIELKAKTYPEALKEARYYEKNY